MAVKARHVATLLGCLSAAFTRPLRAEPAAQTSVRLLELRGYSGVHSSDYSTVGGRTEGFLAARSSLGVTLSGPWQARLDGLYARFSKTHVNASEVAGRFYWHGEQLLLGAAYTYTWLDGGIRSDTVALHAEVYEAPFLTVTSSIGVERKNLGDDLWFCEIFTRLYLGENWLLTPGASYAVSSINQTRADIVLRGEWRFARGSYASTAVFVQYGGNLFSKAAAGITLYFDGLSYREREHRDGLYGARFD
jgi:hypothetical protein